ncbi:unnamed protein product [Miscanthus lutarioriparius]|uniref:GDSL esterase/lipase n=1 Tax=Miscanthus lutarioriparius TaxID=422564 RepID=A0A811S2S5_9POAL|nr:unnamed protein product [Miscanthus lutarioriparius]
MTQLPLGLYGRLKLFGFPCAVARPLRVLHDALHHGMGAPDGVPEPLEAQAEAVHGGLDALVEPARQLVEDVDAGAQRVQAPRVGAAPDWRDVDHRELPRPEHSILQVLRTRELQRAGESCCEHVHLVLKLKLKGFGSTLPAVNMGLKRSPPPFLAVANKTNKQVFRGLLAVNFASAGSGILDTTGSSIIPLSKQVEQFAAVQRNISSRVGNGAAADALLSRSLFLVSTGGNDLFAFFSRNSTPSDADKQQYVGNLVALYQNHVKALYVLGARKFAVIDVPPIGCCPYPRSLHPLGACIDVLNELARGFNKGVKAAMHGLSLSFQGFRYSVGSSHAVVQSIMKHPQRPGNGTGETKKS